MRDRREAQWQALRPRPKWDPQIGGSLSGTLPRDDELWSEPIALGGEGASGHRVRSSLSLTFSPSDGREEGSGRTISVVLSAGGGGTGAPETVGTRNKGIETEFGRANGLCFISAWACVEVPEGGMQFGRSRPVARPKLPSSRSPREWSLSVPRLVGECDMEASLDWIVGERGGMGPVDVHVRGEGGRSAIVDGA